MVWWVECRSLAGSQGDVVYRDDTYSQLIGAVLCNPSLLSGEFERYPNVGFMQCKTTSIRIHNNFWENMIARFTNDVYRYVVCRKVEGCMR